MPYQCRDCSFSKGMFQHGRCPACDSFNITTLGKRSGSKDTTPAKRWRLVSLLALWSVLFYLLYQKL